MRRVKIIVPHPDLAAEGVFGGHVVSMPEGRAKALQRRGIVEFVDGQGQAAPMPPQRQARAGAPERKT